ncbi:MAG: carbohydrate ABC transporter permease [Blautia obeum]
MKLFRNLSRGSFFLPCALSLVATGVAWRYLMGTNYGVINNFLSVLGFEKIGWLTDGKIALGSMAIVTIWRWAGYYMVMVVAGRLEISQEFLKRQIWTVQMHGINLFILHCRS